MPVWPDCFNENYRAILSGHPEYGKSQPVQSETRSMQNPPHNPQHRKGKHCPPFKAMAFISEGSLSLRCSFRFETEDDLPRLKKERQLPTGDFFILFGGLLLGERTWPESRHPRGSGISNNFWINDGHAGWEITPILSKLDLEPQSNGSFSSPYFLNSLTWYFTSRINTDPFSSKFPCTVHFFSTLRHRVAMIFWECFVFCPKMQPPNQINRLLPNWNRISRVTLTSQDKIK